MEQNILIDFIYNRIGAAIDGILLLYGIILNTSIIYFGIYDISTQEFNIATALVVIPVAALGLIGMYHLHKIKKRRTVGVFGSMFFSSFLIIVMPTSDSIIIFCVPAILSLLRGHIYLRFQDQLQTK